MRSENKLWCLLGYGLVAAVILWGSVETYQSTYQLKLNHHDFKSGLTLERPMKIAFLSDLHLRNKEGDFDRLRDITKHIANFSPDIILLGGDFTGEHTAETLLIRERIVTGLSAFAEIAPTFTVLGNHEWWTSDDWDKWIRKAGINVIDNSSQRIWINGTAICLRGLGDAYTGHYRMTAIPENCGAFTVTLTHDPLAIERDPEAGLYLAGHTHCGQIKLPFIHPSWAPTHASEELVCGTGTNVNKTWITTAGVGTSIIPIRFGARAGIELITIL